MNDIMSIYPSYPIVDNKKLNDVLFKYPTKFNLTDLEFWNWARTNKYRCICYHGEFQIFKYNPEVKAYNVTAVYKNKDKVATIGFFTTLLLSSRKEVK